MNWFLPAKHPPCLPVPSASLLPHPLVLSPSVHILFQRVNASLSLHSLAHYQLLGLPSLYLRVALAKVPVRVKFSVYSFPYFLTRLVADGALSAKIAEELKYEKEAALESEPEFLKEFKSAGIWTVCFFFELFFFFFGDIGIDHYVFFSYFLMRLDRRRS